MISAIITALANGFRAAAEFLGLRREEAARKNTPEMQANAQAKTDERIKDEAADAVASGDLDRIRKELSE